MIQPASLTEAAWKGLRVKPLTLLDGKATVSLQAEVWEKVAPTSVRSNVERNVEKHNSTL